MGWGRMSWSGLRLVEMQGWPRRGPKAMLSYTGGGRAGAGLQSEERLEQCQEGARRPGQRSLGGSS